MGSDRVGRWDRGSRRAKIGLRWGRGDVGSGRGGDLSSVWSAGSSKRKMASHSLDRNL